MAKSQPGIESVQLRIRALLSGGKGKPADLPSSPDPRYHWHFLDVWCRDERDPWADAAGADAAAEVARLLIGVLAKDGMYEGREVSREWIDAAETLVDQAARDVESYWRKTVGMAVDHFGENAISSPEHQEALAIGRQTMAGELWEMLLNAESRGEEVTA